VHDGDHPKRFFIRGISDQVIPRPLETRWAAGKVGAPLSLMQERHKTVEGISDIRNHAISGGGILVGDVFPDLGKIDFSLWMKS
jgi:hypothetical protein